jgi:hypothetical protein
MTATPTPPPVEPAAPTPSVPYGPPAGEAVDIPPAAFTVDLSKKSVAGTAGRWAIRILLPLLIRALFRAIFRR